jgi:hypothetical protein
LTHDDSNEKETAMTIKVNVARDARTGRFITCNEARRHPATTVIETVKRVLKRCRLRN